MLIRRFKPLTGRLKPARLNTAKTDSSKAAFAVVWSDIVPSFSPISPSKFPSLQLERSLWAAGYAAVAGCDEVGRGAWAGPVSVGVVVIPRDCPLEGVRDSKMLSEPAREQLFGHIIKWCEAWAVGHAWPQECDDLGMSEAQRLAATRAMDNLDIEPGFMLVDGRWDFVQTGEVEMVVKGDQISLSIAAASVVAKVTRDRMMREISSQCPDFDFANNKGYPSPKHKAALLSQGATDFHRKSWAFMENLGIGQ